jgi:uncharacterized membrane protein YkoI
MKSKCVLMVALAAALAMAVPGSAQTPAPKGTEQAKSTKSKAAAAVPAPSAQEVADAKAKGLVWVNTSTKVYHKEGAYYGTTKHGKFMTEDEAKKAGYSVMHHILSPRTSHALSRLSSQIGDRTNDGCGIGYLRVLADTSIPAEKAIRSARQRQPGDVRVLKPRASAREFTKEMQAVSFAQWGEGAPPAPVYVNAGG